MLFARAAIIFAAAHADVYARDGGAIRAMSAWLRRRVDMARDARASARDARKYDCHTYIDYYRRPLFVHAAASPLMSAIAMPDTPR